MPITVIQGEQRGDEGKGRFVDMLAEEHDIVARFNGGNNAGHTVVLPDERVLKLHLMPSGIAHEHTVNVIGNGTLINPQKLSEEIDGLAEQDIEVSKQNLKISSAAHLILPFHVSEDEIREAGSGSQGSTKSGIAQVAAAKYMRVGARVEMINNDPNLLQSLVCEGLKAQRQARQELDLEPIDESEVAEQFLLGIRKIGQFVTDTSFFLNQELRREKPARVLAEGAQAFLLDIDHGMYPFTTSSSTTSGGVSSGLGVPPQFIDRVIGVSKAAQSHVGGGPFVTEITDQTALNKLHGDLTSVDAERGTTTGRTRRLGNFDIPSIRRSQMVNGTSEMALTKLDWVPRYGDSVKVCVAYERKGKTLRIAPDAAYKLEQCEPQYETLPTWKENIQDIRDFGDLPKEAQGYVHLIEEQTGVPITMIGVGPNREQVIVR